MPRILTGRRALLAAVPAALAMPALAQTPAWPAARPIRLVVPFAAGTTTDIFGRAIGNHLGQTLGQSVVVENRSGAGGNIATAAVARDRPDGYSIILGTSGTHGVNASLYREPGYDPVRDFAPVVPFVTAPVALAVRPQLGVRDFAGLMALARQRPLSFASAGNGTTGHLSQALLDLRGGVQTTHVPYRSGAQAVTDLLSGQVDAMFYHYLPLSQHVQAGSLMVLGVTSPQRTETLPQVPTMLELGLAGFVVEGWWAIYLPAGTPREVVDRVNAATNAWLRSAEAMETLRNQGVAALGGTPEELATRTAAEVAKWRDVIREARIEPG
ncbi:Bug family tripartite tricarboxylate transporter substrate binding protein [Plastoroseomonas arctica]|uniref:Tripartite tricarboxylate transporter substrate binding protein n=1 Tax=Plastoroseomonas arctica TaxID=1509237 RepID=A0AAF1KMK3_9PROT|nr:tripartite tricarboxylate transporter substrate binding protein [Plastoroseomonas arctica]MBR0656546.1 tripartite tricarboxylate transporter substrate binding protein [Plastoroseomonas arctica]